MIRNGPHTAYALILLLTIRFYCSPVNNEMEAFFFVFFGGRLTYLQCKNEFRPAVEFIYVAQSYDIIICKPESLSFLLFNSLYP